MAKVLLLFAHPALEKSRVHARLIRSIHSIQGVTFHDLYEVYPDFDIDIKKEQALLLAHDIIILQHPFYWYSSPAILKQWLDLVLEHGWAYGKEGNNLSGKKMMNAISCGGPFEAYGKEGRNRFTIRQFLAPFDQTAALCKMKYLPPFVIHGTHQLNTSEIDIYAIAYKELITALVQEKPIGDGSEDSYINDFNLKQQLIQP